MIQDGKKKVWKDYQKEIATDNYTMHGVVLGKISFPDRKKPFLKL